MKAWGKFICKVMALAMAVSVISVTVPAGVFAAPETVSAASTAITVDKVDQVRVGELAEDAIDMRLLDVNYSLEVVAQTGLYYKRSYNRIDLASNIYRIKLSLYSAKEGTYKLTLRVKSGDKLVDTATVEVNVTNGDPVKKVKFAGLTLSTDAHKLGAKNVVTTVKEGKLKVKMKSGYTLDGIFLGKNVMQADGTTVKQFTQITNNSNIKLSTVPDYSLDAEDDLVKLKEGMTAETVIRIYYVDKNSGTKSYVDYYLNLLVNYGD